MRQRQCWAETSLSRIHGNDHSVCSYQTNVRFTHDDFGRTIFYCRVVVVVVFEIRFFAVVNELSVATKRARIIASWLFHRLRKSRKHNHLLWAHQIIEMREK